MLVLVRGAGQQLVMVRAEFWNKCVLNSAARVFSLSQSLLQLLCGGPASGPSSPFWTQGAHLNLT